MFARRKAMLLLQRDSRFYRGFNSRQIKKRSNVIKKNKIIIFAGSAMYI